MSLSQELKFNDAEQTGVLESNDTVEIATIVTLWSNMKLDEVFLHFFF